MGGRADILQQIETLFHAGAIGHVPDTELLHRFVSAEGDDAERSFEVLVHRHGPMVLGVCRKVLRDPDDAQDAFQATFLVLARKAGRIGRPERLAPWLHGVASRTAMKARTTAVRRIRHERGRAESVAEGLRPTDDTSELRAALHEEIARLPEKYRTPVVLCHLEGMTRERASAQLGCPEGTIGVRLMRARERLRDGLARRGFAVDAGAVAFGLVAESAPAALIPGLASSTARAGVAFVAGRSAAAGLVSTHVLGLAQGVLSRMRWTRLTILAPAILLAGTLAVGALALTAHPKPPRPEKPIPTPTASRGRDDGSRWKQTLPGGETVELLGITAESEGLGSWWAPDGSPLAAPPAEIHAPNADQSGRRWLTFAARVSSTRDPDKLDASWVVGSSGVGTSTPPWEGEPIVIGAWASLPSGEASRTIRIGIAAGPWKTEVTSGPGGLVSYGMTAGGIMFARPRPIPAGTSLAVADTFGDGPSIRVVAVDAEGKEHGPAATSSAMAGNARLRDLEFRLPLDQIREFRFETRPIEWAEFRDVALRPRAAAKP